MTEKILIVGPSWVGDMVMAQSLFIKLHKQTHPVILDVLAPNWSNSLLERMPEVRRSIVMPFKHGELNLSGRYKLARSLRHTKYDRAIVLPNSFKSALIPWWAKIKLRTGFLGEMRFGVLNDWRKLNKNLYPRMVDRFQALGKAKNDFSPIAKTLYPSLQVDKTKKQWVLDKFNLTLKQPVLALCPGAEFGPAKQWHANHFAAVARAKLIAGWQVWLFGSENDLTINKEINEFTNGACTNLAGKTSLAEAIDLLAQVNWVITNDSGLMHIAAALDRPQIAIYGATSPSFTPPLSNKAKILQLNLECQPCFKKTCPLQHHRCMSDLTPNLVLSSMVDWV